MKIEFTDFGVDDKSVLGFTAKDDVKDSFLTFQMPERFVPAPDLLGLALSTLAGKKYDEIVIDLPLTRRTIATIESVCGAEVKAHSSRFPQSAPSGKYNALNFSGGFDSLAALMTMPKDTKLVSLDFGGNFQREQEFFQRFEPTTITTNFRSHGFAGNSWSFMGIGTILLRDYLEIDSYSFGSIIEAAPWNMRQSTFKNLPHSWYGAAGLKQLNPVQGLTEIGTIMLLAKHCPDLVLDSLKSLAGPGSEKMNRKIMLLNIVHSRFSTGISSEPDSLEPRVNFGDVFASDFLCLYILKHAGIEAASQLVGEIPEKIIKFAKDYQLDFYERLNTNFYENTPMSSNALIYSRCLDASIIPYTANDWSDYRAVAEVLSEWHENLV